MLRDRSQIIAACKPRLNLLKFEDIQKFGYLQQCNLKKNDQGSQKMINDHFLLGSVLAF